MQWSLFVLLLMLLLLCLCLELLGCVFLMLLSPSARLYVRRPLIDPSVEGHPRCAVYFVRYV